MFEFITAGGFLWWLLRKPVAVTTKPAASNANVQVQAPAETSVNPVTVIDSVIQPSPSPSVSKCNVLHYK